MSGFTEPITRLYVASDIPRARARDRNLSTHSANPGRKDCADDLPPVTHTTNAPRDAIRTLRRAIGTVMMLTINYPMSAAAYCHDFQEHGEARHGNMWQLDAWQRSCCRPSRLGSLCNSPRHLHPFSRWFNAPYGQCLSCERGGTWVSLVLISRFYRGMKPALRRFSLQSCRHRSQARCPLPTTPRRKPDRGNQPRRRRAFRTCRAGLLPDASLQFRDWNG